MLHKKYTDFFMARQSIFVLKLILDSLESSCSDKLAPTKDQTHHSSKLFCSLISL